MRLSEGLGRSRPFSGGNKDNSRRPGRPITTATARAAWRARPFRKATALSGAVQRGSFTQLRARWCAPATSLGRGGPALGCRLVFWRDSAGPVPGAGQRGREFRRGISPRRAHLRLGEEQRRRKVGGGQIGVAQVGTDEVGAA